MIKAMLPRLIVKAQRWGHGAAGGIRAALGGRDGGQVQISFISRYQSIVLAIPVRVSQRDT
jgi:hypothetical protein